MNLKNKKELICITYNCKVDIIENKYFETGFIQFLQIRSAGKISHLHRRTFSRQNCAFESNFKNLH